VLSFSGITCNSTGNTRLARELIHNAHPTIIILADPCHQLHNSIKDICNLEYFAEVRIYAAYYYPKTNPYYYSVNRL
jgi:hypothetical protein